MPSANQPAIVTGATGTAAPASLSYTGAVGGDTSIATTGLVSMTLGRGQHESSSQTISN